MKIVRCPYCDGRFEMVWSMSIYGKDKGYERHLIKCAKMSEKARAYYKEHHSWPRRGGAEEKRRKKARMHETS